MASQVITKQQFDFENLFCQILSDPEKAMSVVKTFYANRRHLSGEHLHSLNTLKLRVLSCNPPLTDQQELLALIDQIVEKKLTPKRLRHLNETNLCLESLPSELRVFIFSRLSVGDLAAVSTTCRQFHAEINDQVLLKSLVREERVYDIYQLLDRTFKEAQQRYPLSDVTENYRLLLNPTHPICQMLAPFMRYFIFNSTQQTQEKLWTCLESHQKPLLFALLGALPEDLQQLNFAFVGQLKKDEYIPHIPNHLGDLLMKDWVLFLQNPHFKCLKSLSLSDIRCNPENTECLEHPLPALENLILIWTKHAVVFGRSLFERPMKNFGFAKKMTHLKSLTLEIDLWDNNIEREMHEIKNLERISLCLTAENTTIIPTLNWFETHNQSIYEYFFKTETAKNVKIYESPILIFLNKRPNTRRFVLTVPLFGVYQGEQLKEQLAGIGFNIEIIENRNLGIYILDINSARNFLK